MASWDGPSTPSSTELFCVTTGCPGHRCCPSRWLRLQGLPCCGKGRASSEELRGSAREKVAASTAQSTSLAIADAVTNNRSSSSLTTCFPGIFPDTLLLSFDTSLNKVFPVQPYCETQPEAGERVRDQTAAEVVPEETTGENHGGGKKFPKGIHRPR